MAATFALGLGAAPAAAQTWHLVASVGESPGRLAHWIEAESVQREGAEVHYRIREVRESASPQGGYDGLQVRSHANCETREYGTVELIAHFADGTSRTVAGDGRMNPPPPVDTLIGREIEVACGRHPLGEGVADPEAATRALWAGR